MGGQFVFSVAVFTVFCLMVTGSSADVIYDRPCRTDVEVVQNFCLDRYLGKWYEQQRYEQEFQTSFDCVQAKYAFLDHETVSVVNSAYSLLNDSSISAVGSAVLSFPEEEIVQAKLNVSFFGAPNDRSNYWVVDTDYENFSVVWSCEPLDDNQSKEGFWLLSRTHELVEDAQVHERVNNALDKYIDKDVVRVTNQVDERCPEF